MGCTRIRHKHKLEIAQNRIRTYSDCLIIFDNLEENQNIEKYLPEPQVEPHILVTSRFDQPGFRPTDLDPLDEALSLKLLIQEADREPKDEADWKAAREIAEALGGLPLALELAGAYLRRKPIRWERYNELLKQNLSDALPDRISSFTKHEEDLYSTLGISDDVLGEEPLLKEILDLLTWSSSAPMGLSLMSTLLEVEKIELTSALGLGTALRLLQESSKGEQYSIHRLLREVRRKDIPLEECQDWIKNICEHVGEWFQKHREEFNDLPQYEAEIDHLSAWQEHALDFASGYASKLICCTVIHHFTEVNIKIQKNG